MVIGTSRSSTTPNIINPDTALQFEFGRGQAIRLRDAMDRIPSFIHFIRESGAREQLCHTKDLKSFES